MTLRVEPDVEAIPGYRLLERIGGGGFGEVWKAEAPGGLHKAIKIIHGDLRSIDKDGSRHAEQELRALKRLQAIRHPYLLSLERYDVVDGRLLIVTELADCNLWDRFRQCRAQNLPGIPRSELLRYLEEAAEVLDLMNNQYQLQHLDIKPQNLFLVYNHVKVADFGLVKDLEGMQGVITGGVTPVYAAPETFNNTLTRYCDQYSLAIVYQELLTGARPFNGTSGQQLLMQHIREAPNLAPLPPSDRAAVGRALSKKPEDRFPSCMHFVQELSKSGSMNQPTIQNNLTMSSMRVDTPGTNRNTPVGNNSSSRFGDTPAQSALKSDLYPRREESSSQSQYGTYTISDTIAEHKTAPPEQTGDGILLPAIVIGLGEIGLHVLREFRRSAIEMIGGMERIPHIKSLFLDTDSDTLHKAQDGQVGLPAQDVIPARLNRAAHYMKTRRNGRTLVEGWFDPQTLYKIPRNPATLGIRSLGRLAFLDHYRLFAERITSDVESITQPDTLNKADRHTKLGLRTNRPRVYIACHLAGGTGSGMFIDAAYAVRHKLRQQGYLEPEIVGVFVIPHADRMSKGPGLANTYAALRELHHYSQPNTVFSAHYEERDGRVNDPAPPFTRYMLMPLPATPKGSTLAEQVTDAMTRRAGNLIARDLLTPLGRATDEGRWHKAEFGETPVNISVMGQCSFTWPKNWISRKVARWLTAVTVNRWIENDQQVIGQYVDGWLQQRWQIENLTPEMLISQVQKVGERVFGQSAETYFAAEAQPFAQKGWFSREPDPARMNQTFTKLLQYVGMPDDRSMQRSIGTVEVLIQEAAEQLAQDVHPRMMRLATTMLEHPDYRFVGAEQVVKQMISRFSGLIDQYEAHSTKLNDQAIEAYENVYLYINAPKHPRRPVGSEAVESLRNYPTWRFQSLVLRHVCRIYLDAIRALEQQQNDFVFCRQRLAEMIQQLINHKDAYVPSPERTLLPAGMPSIDSAIEVLQQSITDQDMRNFDKKLQQVIEKEYNTLLNVCQSSDTLLTNLLATIEQHGFEFISKRLSSTHPLDLFFARYKDLKTASQAMNWLYEQSVPPLNLIPSERVESFMMACPSGAYADQMLHIVKNALPNAPTEVVQSEDEILFYREYSQVPLTALVQVGTIGEDAYNTALEGTTPHFRYDVPTWEDIESDA